VITGTVRVDLTDVPQDRQKHRVDGGFRGVPDGARVVLVVGALTVGAEALRFLLEHTERLHIDVHGETFAVRRWVEALRTGEIPGLLV